MNLRKTVSLTLLLSLVLCILTSAVLYIVPAGRVAYWSDWRLWGLDKDQWTELHVNLGVLFVLAGLLHVYLNWGPITAYLKDKARRFRLFTADFNIALLITLLFVLGTYFRIPPMSTITDISQSIESAAE